MACTWKRAQLLWKWPARPSGLITLDLSCEGYLKIKVYSEPIQDLEHQKQVIKRHIEELKEDPELLKDVMFEITNRVNQCIEANGGHFEYKRCDTRL